MEKSDIINILKLDQNLINEAFRRLVEGVFNLKTEDRDFINELFDKANQAVKDHIDIEEEGLLPKIDLEEASLMRREHNQLVKLLDEARYALISERPVAFEVLISTLKDIMTDHAKIEAHLFKAIDVGSFDHEAIASLQSRIAGRIV